MPAFVTSGSGEEPDLRAHCWSKKVPVRVMKPPHTLLPPITSRGSTPTYQLKTLVAHLFWKKSRQNGFKQSTDKLFDTIATEDLWQTIT